MEIPTERLKMAINRLQLIAIILITLFSGILIKPVEAQPYPPINIAVTSRIADNRLTWSHHPQNPAGYVANYIVCRGTTYGNTVPIFTAAANATSFNDNTAGYSYDQEFYYTVMARGTDNLLSERSEQVMRFLPVVGLTGTGMGINTINSVQYGSWKPYPGQWTDTYTYISTTPDGTSNGSDYPHRQIIRASRALSLTEGTTYYLRVRIDAPDWWGSPAARRTVSYSSSLPFVINSTVPYEDNASSTYFNNSQNRVMAEPLATGGVGTTLFSNNGGNFWRIRRPVGVSAHVNNLVFPSVTPNAATPARINSPCRVVITGIPAGEIAETRADDEVRVADQYGNELPCVVFNETAAAGSVTGFDVHFITSQDGTAQEIYWIYWGNPDASVPTYTNPGFSDNFSKTSQFAVSPWYSRRIHRGGIETAGIGYAATTPPMLIATPPTIIDDMSASQPLGFVFPYFNFATNTVNVSTNGYISFPPDSQSLNTWAGFTGASPNRFIAPFWCNLMENDTVPSNAGLYYHNLDSGTAARHRAMFTWRANRFNATTESYIFQAALYRQGDIAFRYDTLNFGALKTVPSLSGDNPINVPPHHTAGISATDGNRWLGITDDTTSQEVVSLRDGSGRNVIHYFQSCHGWTINLGYTDPTNTCSMAGPTCVADYESRIFDGRSSAPTWTNMEYQITGTGLIDLYVRSSGTTNFPAWNAGHLVGANLAASTGVINLTLPTDRYVQYKAVFKKSNSGENPVLRRVKFSVGYVTIDSVTNQYNNLDVSQGQTFPASMTYTNKYSNPVDTIAASLTFTAGANQTWVHTASMPANVLPEDSATVSFSITVDQNSGNLNNWTTVNGYLEAGDGLATLTNSTALITSRYIIRKKAELIINSVDTTFEKVNKGQGGIPVKMTISNGSPQVPLVLQTASLTFSLGQYTLSPEFVFDPADQGLFGSYFYTTTGNPPPFPTQASATRLDSTVNFNWGAASPIPGVISADYFAVRWSGYVIPEFSEDYTFYFWADDGVRVWVNGQMIINSWVTSAFERTSASVSLTAGVPAEIVIDYYERASNARAELSWSAPSQTKQIIPAGRLKPAYLPVIHGGQSITLNYTVAVQPTSPSGVAYIKGIASGTNAWVPGLVTDSSSPLVFDSWIIQSPASLSIGLIKAPAVVYRGQANIPVEVEIINTGEADAQIASIPLFISLGDYENIIPGQIMPVTITGGQSKFIKVLVSILESTATGSAIIDAEVSGTDVNNGSSLSTAGAAVPGEWTVLAEKILSYKDPSYLYPSNAFSRPDSGETFIYALAENLVPLKEYGIRWYDASGSEIISATTIGFSDNTGKLAGEWSINPSTSFGVYTVKITNPVNTYSPSQTNFRVVTSASVSATLELPQKVSVGQAFQGRMIITNIGGAEAAGMVPDPLTIAGPGTANLISGPSPAAIDVPGESTATITYNYTATGQGNFQISAGASGFDASNDKAIQAAYIDSNLCLIQTPAIIDIVSLTATPTIVYRDQKNIEVMMALQNTGEADAIISLADLRSPPNNNLSFATFTLASPTIPATVPGNSTATFTFRVNINGTAPAGPAVMTARVSYTDANNPTTPVTLINQTLSWTINTANLLLYINNTFTTPCYAFNDGSTVFARASGLATNTNVRIRFYESTEPYPPVDVGVGILTPLNTGDTGIVSHPGHLIPPGTDKLQRWMAVVDDGDDATVGNIFAVQFFDVFSLATFSVSLEIASPTCFVGDLVNANLTINNIATWPTNVRLYLNSFNHSYLAHSAGTFNRISAQTGVYQPSPSGSSKVYSSVLQATKDSAIDGSSLITIPGNSLHLYDDSFGVTTYYTNYPLQINAQNPTRVFRNNFRLETLPQPPSEPGLRGEYYNLIAVNATQPMPISDPATTTINANVNFNWGGGSPVPGVVNADYHAVRWSGLVTPDFSENYTFFARTDDGFRLWVNGNLIYEDWVTRAAIERSGSIALTAGVPVPIVLEMFSNTGTSIAELRWQSPSVAKSIIPAANLSYIPYQSPIWDFGIAEPGSISSKIANLITNTGNHNLERIRLSQVDLRKSVSESISGSNLTADPPFPFNLPVENDMTFEASVLIPFYQPPGVYVATMAIFEDHNDSQALDLAQQSREPHTLIFTKVEVKAVAKAVLTDSFIDLGVIEAGATSTEQQIEIIGVGNQNLTDLKFDDMSAHGITITPLIFGAMAYNGYQTASISVTVPLAQPPGVFYATGTIRDDIPGGASEDFTVKWAVGTQTLAVSPELMALGNATPTFTLPTFVTTIDNTGELPLSRLKGVSTEFINQSQAGTIASDNVNLTSPSLIDVADSETTPVYVYVPGGKATGTYLASFTWYEDLNLNQNPEVFEAKDMAIASFVIQAFYRLYSLKSTEDFGGVKPDTTKTVSVGVRNAGSLPITRLRFITSDLSDGTDIFDDAHMTVPADVLNIAPGELRYFDLSAAVPAAHTKGVFIGSMTVYGDLDTDDTFDTSDEPWCDIKLRIEIGDQAIAITAPVEAVMAGNAASSTNQISVTTKNTGSMALSRVRTQGTDLIATSGAVIASTSFQYSPSALLGSLVINQSRSNSAWVFVPFGQSPGLYEGSIWSWEDANNDGIRQPEETAASIPVKLTVTTLKAVQTSPTSINLGVMARGDLATASVLAQNVGNTGLVDARWEKGILNGPTPIAATSIAITPDPVGVVVAPPVGLPENIVSTLTLTIPTTTSDGLYNGVMVFFDDDIDPALNVFNTGLEQFANLTVTVQVVTPFFTVNPDPIVIPASDPTGPTASGAFTISNSGSIAFKKPRYSISNLANGASTIASSTVKIVPAAISALLPGQNEAAEISTTVSPATAYPPGVYSGVFTIYDDRNNNNVRDAYESFLAVPVNLTVNSYPRLDIIPASFDAGKIARNTFSPTLRLGFRNTGNTPLNGLIWSKSDLFKAPGVLIPVASLAFSFSQPEPINPGAVATAELIIGRISPDQELGGPYGPSEQFLQSGTAVDSVFIECEIIPGGPQGLDKGSVWQEVATKTFPVAPLTSNYLLSAYVCPGSGSARIGFLMTDEVGIQTGYSGIEVGENGNASLIGATGAVLEKHLVEYAPGVELPWYRVFIQFSYGFDSAVASKTYILLQNTGPEGLGHAAWFDGIQLEKAKLNQTKPTSWSDRAKIIAPGQASDLSGRNSYYEW